MTEAAEERDPLAELVTLAPVFLFPLTWWLAWRAFRSRELAPESRRSARLLAARRLTGLAAFDSVVAAMVAAARWLAPVRPLDEPAVLELEPSSPFEPLPGVECGELWHDQLFWMLWPVVLGCALVFGLWVRARLQDRERSGRWGLVLLPMASAPLVGIAAGHAVCTALGGWSVGAGLLGVIAQGSAMAVLGGLAMRYARDELRVVVGPRIASGRSALSTGLFVLSALARVALLVFSVWSLSPGLRGIHDTGIEAVLAGEHGPLGRGLVVFAAVVVAPVAEEILFRGLLLPGLAQSMSARGALLVSASVFALFHVPSHGVAAVLPGILGLGFGWARLRSGGVAAPIALHVANNLLVTLLTWTTG